MTMTGPQIIVLATPVFLGLIAIELAIGHTRANNTYRLHDALSSIGLGVMSQIVGVFTVLFTAGIYIAVYQRFAPWQLPATSPWTWALALIGYDFLYYWHHRAGHRIAVLWAAHVVHHQSEDYNLSTALRQTSSGWLFGWVFYLPLALLGVPPLVVGGVGLIDLLYQFWVHTEQVGRLGWFDRWFCAPSNHRVHHAVNDAYLDRNFGGVLIVWDRLFGTYAEEDPALPCRYGTRAPLRSWNPIRANVQIYAELARDSWRARDWRDKLLVWWKPPGWRPADVAARWPKPPFDIAAFERYDPPMAATTVALALGLFVVILVATTLLLWNAHALVPAAQAVIAIGVALVLCLVGWLTEAHLPGAVWSVRRRSPSARSGEVTSRPRT
jgi:sterol desaturase/sphingolipid hydroxylase (fatty acid hydroxylase superfamily)